jgi:hypothetical protein
MSQLLTDIVIAWAWYPGRLMFRWASLTNKVKDIEHTLDEVSLEFESSNLSSDTEILELDIAVLKMTVCGKGWSSLVVILRDARFWLMLSWSGSGSGSGSEMREAHCCLQRSVVVFIEISEVSPEHIQVRSGTHFASAAPWKLLLIQSSYEPERVIYCLISLHFTNISHYLITDDWRGWASKSVLNG